MKAVVLAVAVLLVCAGSAEAHRVKGYPSIQRFENVPVQGPLLPGQERPEIVYDRAEGYIYLYSDRCQSWTQLYPRDADYGVTFVGADNFEFRATGRWQWCK